MSTQSNMTLSKVLWPSAVVLAHYLVEQQCVGNGDTPMLRGFGFGPTSTGRDTNARGLRILELGSGCGLVGIVAARLLVQQQQEEMTMIASSSSPTTPQQPRQQQKPLVILTDFNRTVLQNLQRNIILNDVQNVASVVGLDFSTIQRQQDDDDDDESSTTPSVVATNGWHDMDGHVHDPVDWILAADVICQPSDAAAVARTIDALLVPGGTALLVSATARHRFGVDRLVDECAMFPNLTVRWTDLVLDANDDEDDSRASLRSLLQEHASGYVPGMMLQMFHVTKKVKCDGRRSATVRS
jgi:predicted nicotinamide N-methyase